MDADDERAYVRQQLIDAMQSAAPDAAAKLGFGPDDKDAQLVISELGLAMFNAGVRAGATQAAAQAAEQGIDVTINMDPSILPDAD
jgi:hypothetical protein